MKAKIIASALLILAGIIASGQPGSAQQKESEGKTLSPYFFVKSDNPELDQLPLKSTSAAVNIAGVIADVTVTQVYKNEGSHPLEAIYIFPASTRAAVYAMKMTIGERIIVAKIKKRDEARQDYEHAKQNGQSASLLEQQRPNVFQMNVANIMPGDEIKVQMSYTELLIPTNKEYEFVYPTVVGPRYSNQAAETTPASEKWVQNPYQHQGEAPSYSFGITVNIEAGMTIQKLTSPSHKIDVNYHGPSNAIISLDESERTGGNRDYILKYRLAGDQIESGLLLYPGDKEKFFLLMLQPPKRVTSDQIPGREYIFIVDVSGSMHGFPLEISKKLLMDLIGNLRPTDMFNVLLFSGGSTLMSDHSLPATVSNIQKAIRVIENQQGGGGTELLPALKRALGLPRQEGYSRTVVIATDGYVTVEEEVFDLVRNNLGNANMFAFGIGSSVNRHIIEGMAHVGMGEPFVITKPEEAPAKAAAFRKMIESPVLTQIKVDFGDFETYDVEPRSIPDVLADRPIVMFGKWRGKPRGTIRVSGIAGHETHNDTVEVSSAGSLKTNGALQYLWARQRIMLLSDYNMLRPDDERVKEVTSLGLTYNLLTAYTSFVAVDSEVRNLNGNPSTVNQPLPLPDGVSDYAIGELKPSVPVLMKQRGYLPEPEAKAAHGTTGTIVARADKRENATLKSFQVTSSGGLTKEAVENVIKGRWTEIQNCFSSHLSGRLVLKLRVRADGTIKNINIDPKNKAAKQCLSVAAKQWHFPSSPRESDVTIVLELQ